MNRKCWRSVPYDKGKAQILASETGVDAFAVLLLQSRGFATPQALGDFLDAGDATLSSPYLLKDMDNAVRRIRAAVDAGERILVYGDYDCDGVTATALLYSYLQTLGADVSYFIPSRERDGYGLSAATAERVVREGYSLVITVDTGISSVEEAAYFKRSGVDLVVTDHHQPGETLPDAVAVVDPHRADDVSPCKDLAGVGVALKLCAALEDGDYDLLLAEHGDLAALGTVADIVPLLGENRTLVIGGLAALAQTDRVGLRALLESTGRQQQEITSAAVAFTLAPRINAAGRMGDAETALRLLLTEDPDEAASLVEAVNGANADRQRTEAEILAAVERQLAETPALAEGRVIVTAGEGWHPGVIGIVAARLTETYGRPAAVISIGPDGVCRGSARSIEGYSLYEALDAVKDTLLRFGGHTLAAGFSVERDRIPEFRAAINAYAARLGDVYPRLSIDCRLNPAHLTPEILQSLSLLEPFGAGNPQPVFGLFGVEIQTVRPLGGNRHIRVTVAKNGVTVPTVFFGQPQETFPYFAGDAVDLAIRIEKNVYQGEARLSLQIRDIRPAGSDDDKLFASVWAWRAATRGEELAPAVKKALLPDRALLGRVFKAVKNGNGALPPEVIAARLGLSAGRTGSVLCALTALTEVGVLKKDEKGWSDAAFSGKADLESSPLLRRLSGG